MSALIAARWKWRNDAAGEHDRTRGLMIASRGAHSSVAQAGLAMDADVVLVPTDEAGRMHGDDLAATVAALPEPDRRRLFAIVATSGTTNAGIVDDLAGAADVCEQHDVWLHVDGAYGGAALAAPSVRPLFDGIERADSFIVDPHKWLFAPFDCCALLYRDPRVAKAAHSQQAEYLDVLQDDNWNASDYAHHLSRRARGLPLWFSLATYGTDAYRFAIETTLTVAHAGADLIRQSDHCELVLEPELSVVVFRRIGWTNEQYRQWSDEQLATQQSFVVPTSWQGETVLRYCVVNPLTTVDDLAMIVESLS